MSNCKPGRVAGGDERRGDGRRRPGITWSDRDRQWRAIRKQMRDEYASKRAALVKKITKAVSIKLKLGGFKGYTVTTQTPDVNCDCCPNCRGTNAIIDGPMSFAAVSVWISAGGQQQVQLGSVVHDGQGNPRFDRCFTSTIIFSAMSALTKNMINKRLTSFVAGVAPTGVGD